MQSVAAVSVACPRCARACSWNALGTVGTRYSFPLSEDVRQVQLAAVSFPYEKGLAFASPGPDPGAHVFVEVPSYVFVLPASPRSLVCNARVVGTGRRAPVSEPAKRVAAVLIPASPGTNRSVGVAVLCICVE